MAAVHANPDVQAIVLVGDGAQGMQHPLLVGLGRHGDTRHEDDLSSVHVDISREEADIVRGRFLLNDGD